MQVQSSKKTVIMPSYRFSTKFKLTLHLIFFLNFVGNVLYSHSVLYDIIENSRLAKHIRTNELNSNIFQHVQKFIIDTKRF